MKKLIATVIAGVFAASSVACLAACGDKSVAEKADKEAPAYAEGEWDASLDLNAVMTGDEGAISPDLFGLFLEDINYAGFALDDNLIINGSFETLSSATSNTKEYGWTENDATVTVRSGEGALHANNQSYASVTTAAANGKLSNSGHAEVPVAVKKNTEYKFSMFIKDYAGDVTVSVKDKGGDEYASGTFTVAESAEWTKYIKTVKATGTAEEDLRVEIAFSAADTFSIDSVKFETADATDFGMKNYMYKAIEELGPKFFRFPGGCVIEGKNMNSAYDWKNSIGAVSTGNEPGDDDVQAFSYPVNDNGKVSTATPTYGEQATRKENLDIWQASNNYYNLEYGIGFYEFFCLCDALNAKAVPIVNCGASCMIQTNGPGNFTKLNGRHNNGISDYIQDAIDLIEFAKGATSTKWGAIREKMGHPEPFAMDYIGVGNEQWGAYYKDYYEEFLKNEDFQAALAKYKVQPIMGNGVAFGDCENSDGKGKKGTAQNAALTAKESHIVDTVAEYGVVDQHYYVNYTDLFTHTKMYDNYARPSTSPDTYYNVFVGEYAANTAAAVTGGGGNFNYSQNDWISALSEAAMMTGFERNGDIVKLAAYAPMFGVADKLESAREAGKSSNQWNAANMMYFTNNTVVCTPSYYVQQLFMKNSGTRKVVSSLTFAEGDMPQTTVKQKTGSGTRTYDNIYYVTSYDEATKNLIVKIVNAGDTGMKFNVNVKADKTLTGIAQVTEVVGDDPTDVNTYTYYDTVTAGKPYKIGFENGAFGISLKPYSVIAIRIRTK